MFNDPKYKNLVNDISNILAENDKKYYDELLPEQVVNQIDLAVEDISKLTMAEQTAEDIAKIMKNHFFEGVRNAQVNPTNEMSSEFYRRVFEMMHNMKKKNKKNDKANGAY